MRQIDFISLGMIKDFADTYHITFEMVIRQDKIDIQLVKKLPDKSVKKKKYIFTNNQLDDLNAAKLMMMITDMSLANF